MSTRNNHPQVWQAPVAGSGLCVKGSLSVMPKGTGFARVLAERAGRPGYDPAALLKLYPRSASAIFSWSASIEENLSRNALMSASWVCAVSVADACLSSELIRIASLM